MDEQFRMSLEAIAADYRERMAALRRVQEEVRSITCSARTEDELVEVEVGPQGQLRDVRLDPRVYEQMPPARLSEAIVRLASRAGGDAGRRVGELVAGVVPGAAPAGFDPSEWLPDTPELLGRFLDRGSR